MNAAQLSTTAANVNTSAQMSIDEVTKAIRADLKAAGFSSRKISVRQVDDGVCVTIRASDIPLCLVEKIANRYEDIRKDCHGEPLLGGNTYVDVRRVSPNFNAQQVRIASALPKLKNPISRAKTLGFTVELDGEGYYHATRPGLEGEIRCWGAEMCARLMLEDFVARMAAAAK